MPIVCSLAHGAKIDDASNSPSARANRVVRYGEAIRPYPTYAWASWARGRSRRSAQMSKAEQFREFANETFQWSRKAKTEAARQILLGLAFTWIQAALISERTFVGP